MWIPPFGLSAEGSTSLLALRCADLAPLAFVVGEGPASLAFTSIAAGDFRPPVTGRTPSLGDAASLPLRCAGEPAAALEHLRFRLMSVEGNLPATALQC